MDQPSETITVHASAVALQGRAVLIEGPSGAGKSALALALMAHGAVLVADDRVMLRRLGDQVLAAPPDSIAGRIEARGVGILNADFVKDVPVVLLVSVAEMETDRLPPRRRKNLLGVSLPVVHNSGTQHFVPALLQYLIGGRHA